MYFALLIPLSGSSEPRDWTMSKRKAKEKDSEDDDKRTKLDKGTLQSAWAAVKEDLLRYHLAHDL